MIVECVFSRIGWYVLPHTLTKAPRPTVGLVVGTAYLIIRGISKHCDNQVLVAIKHKGD
jgi:hypothetical protein